MMDSKKVVAKARTKYPTTVIKTMYAGTRLKNRDISGEEPDLELIAKNTDLEVVGIDGDKLLVISPIDPDKVLLIAAEAVELFNEGLGIFQSVKAFFGKVGGFFKSAFAAIGSLFKRK